MTEVEQKLVEKILNSLAKDDDWQLSWTGYGGPWLERNKIRVDENGRIDLSSGHCDVDGSLKNSLINAFSITRTKIEEKERHDINVIRLSEISKLLNEWK
jgi:hypothetical protein